MAEVTSVYPPAQSDTGPKVLTFGLGVHTPSPDQPSLLSVALLVLSALGCHISGTTEHVLVCLAASAPALLWGQRC